jgi:hypothetical protein
MRAQTHPRHDVLGNGVHFLPAGAPARRVNYRPVFSPTSAGTDSGRPHRSPAERGQVGPAESEPPLRPMSCRDGRPDAEPSNETRVSVEAIVLSGPAREPPPADRVVKRA